MILLRRLSGPATADGQRPYGELETVPNRSLRYAAYRLPASESDGDLQLVD